MSKVFECRHAIGEDADEYIRKTQHEEKLYGLLEVLRKYSPESFGHSVAVAGLAGRLAEKLGLDKKNIVRIEVAGLFHDIGKLTIPLSILHKKGPLTRAEKELMQTHPDAGYKLLLPYINDVNVLLAVKQHHERMDGSGYPDNISRSIIEFAKIVMLADVYDGMTRKRVYRSEKISEACAKRMMEKDWPRYEGEYLQIFLQEVV